MKKNTKYTPGVSGCPEQQFKPGNSHRWPAGVSGNPAGKSKRRSQFEDVFNEALITQGSAQEAAQLLWEAARNKEPWAIQELVRRFAPQTQSLHLIHETNDEQFDYGKLTDEQLDQLDTILDQARAQPPGGEEGEGEKKAA